MARPADDQLCHSRGHPAAVHLLWHKHRPHASAVELLPVARPHAAFLLRADTGREDMVYTEVP